MRNFPQVQGNRRHRAEAYSCTPHKRFQTCHAKGVIDAEIVEKGYIWTETSLRFPISHSGFAFNATRHMVTAKHRSETIYGVISLNTAQADPARMMVVAPLCALVYDLA
jgi:hypothetical protein